MGMNAATLESSPVHQSHDLLGRLDALLSSGSDGLHVSIYCPAGRLPEEAKAAMIAFKNQVSKVSKELEKAGGAGAELLEKVEGILHECADISFWNRQLGGVAVFVNKERSELFQVSAPLPEQSRVGHHFCLKPLLALGSNLNIYHLLAISKNEVKLYRGSALGLREVDCPGLAESYGAAVTELGYPDGSKKQAAAESNFKVRDEDLGVFLKHLDDAVSKYLSNSDAPLIVAGDRMYEPIYREVNTYPHLSEGFIEGNPEHRSAAEVADLAQDALRSDFIDSQRRALIQFKQMDEAPVDRVAKGLKDVLIASVRGQVDSAFLPGDADDYGTFDPDKGTLELSASPSVADEELYERAARQVLANGGEVFFLEERQLPTDAKAIATLRWEDPTLSNNGS